MQVIRTYDEEGTRVAAKDSARRAWAAFFRVWQIWETMVELKKTDVVRFVAAAGSPGRYATLPVLHCPYLHHGTPPMKQMDDPRSPVRDREEFKRSKRTARAKICGTNEEPMLEIYAATALAGVEKA
jgi:hypothetical protein